MRINMKSRSIAVTGSIALCLSLAAPALAAIRYETVTVVTTEGQKPLETRAEGWIEGDKARIEFRDSGNPMMPAGDYLITTDGGTTVYLVDPEEKTYSEFDLEQLFASLGAVMESMGGMVDLEVSDLEVVKLAEETGPTLHGYDTTHYRYRTSYTMTMRIMGMSRPNTVERTQDIWSTDALDDAAFSVWLQKTPRTGFEDIDELIDAEMSKVDGVALKMEETSVTTGKKGRNQTRSTTSMEVTDLERGVGVPASHFEVPEGYTQTRPTVGAQGPESEEEGGNPFRRILGGGR